LIPVSDSGKAVQTLAFEHHPCSFDRGFAPCLSRKNHLQESRAFWLLFGGAKSNKENFMKPNFEFEQISLFKKLSIGSLFRKIFS